MKRLLVLAGLLVLALALASPVAAAPPVIETGTLVDDYPIWDSLCPGFVVWDREEISFRWTSYFDNEGNLIKGMTHYTGQDNFYNPANPGVVLCGSFSGIFHWADRKGPIVYASGLASSITIPGYGAVMLRAGRWDNYPNGHLAGKDSFDEPAAIAAFCAYLAGD